MIHSEERNPGNRFYLDEVVIRLKKGRRLYSEKRMDCAEAAMEVMKEELAGYDREVLCIVNLDTHLRPVNFNLAAVGSLGQCNQNFLCRWFCSKKVSG